MTQLTFATPEHLESVLRLVADFHREEGIEQDDTTLRSAVLPLLEGSPHGAIYIAGPVRAPIGYIVVTFGWSLEFGGMDGFVDEIYIRPGVRGRGLGTELLSSMPKTLAESGVKALHLKVARSNTKARAVYEKMGFEARENYVLMSRRF